MGKIVSQKLATKDSWIFSKSFHVFTVRKKSELKKKKAKPKEKMMICKSPYETGKDPFEGLDDDDSDEWVLDT